MAVGTAKPSSSSSSPQLESPSSPANLLANSAQTHAQLRRQKNAVMALWPIMKRSFLFKHVLAVVSTCPNSHVNLKASATRLKVRNHQPPRRLRIRCWPQAAHLHGSTGAIKPSAIAQKGTKPCSKSSRACPRTHERLISSPQRISHDS